MTDGEDVRQLERNLRALGYDPGDVDDDWDWETTDGGQAVPARPRPRRRRHARARRGRVPDGRDRGSARPRPPSAIRSRPGRPVAEISSTERGRDRRRSTRSRQQLARTRATSVTVDLPTGRRPSNGRIADGRQGREQGGRGRDPTIDVTITLRGHGGEPRPGAGRRRLRRRAAQGRAGGAGQGAARPPGRRVRGRARRGGGMVPVEPGLYADDMVEVEGDGAARGPTGGDGAMSARSCELVDVRKAYPGGVEALRGVSLTVRRGRGGARSSGRRARASRRCCT